MHSGVTIKKGGSWSKVFFSQSGTQQHVLGVLLLPRPLEVAGLPNGQQCWFLGR